MLGVMKYIATRYDVTHATLLGASAGGLIAVLAACEVDLDTAVERAYQLSLEYDLWQRPLGVVGVWGALIRRWLDDLLPEDAHLRCGRVRLVATELPRLQQVYLQVGVYCICEVVVCGGGGRVYLQVVWVCGCGVLACPTSDAHQ